MVELAEKVSFLEEIMQRVAYTQIQANISIDRLSRKMSDFTQEVLDFIDYLIANEKHKKSSKKFNFSWEGGLSDLKAKYNSVALQHQSREWR